MRDPIIQPEAQELATTGRWWWSLFNASEEAQMICGLDGVARHVNPKAARIFKLKPAPQREEFSIQKVLPPAANQRLSRIIKNNQAPSETVQSVIVALDDASSLLMDLEVVRLEGDLILVTFKHATTRHRLESHVQRLITAVDATPDVFLVTDSD